MTEETNSKTFQLHPIGRVVMDESDGRCLLKIAPPYREALRQLDRFSHAMVFWWAHQMDNEDQRQILSTDLPYAPGEKVGVFACRAEYRPNPFAVTTLPVLAVDVEAGEVALPWIDAYDGSPLLDIKPYIPICDRIREVHVAPWMADWPMWMEDAPAYFAEHETNFGD
jgi:tRNA-Thr(GGU) m(6)t(6)A37 methyltransferase TsaA